MEELIMNESMVIEKIKLILQGKKFLVSKEKTEEINRETSLIMDFSLDSLQILELIVDIEQAFEFSCSAKELDIDMFDNMGGLIDLILEKTAQTTL
jgi:acyl carrier protein